MKRFSDIFGGATGTAAISQIRRGVIGEGMMIDGPIGQRPLTYADYTASGRLLQHVEDFMGQHVLPYYANSHTEASFCGAHTTQIREAARDFIGTCVNASSDDEVIFVGSGATGAVNKLVALLGLKYAESTSPAPVVLIGPYEHHSNILPWRESVADVVEIGTDDEVGVDLDELEKMLKAYADRPLIIGSFSATSNVTGIRTDVDAVTRLLKAYGALALWDYAAGAPYLPMDMNPVGGPAKDAMFISPHKFIGGPGASGLLVVKRSIISETRPTLSGGGTVSFVSPWEHDYVTSLHEREEAGTPNILGDIRAALAFAVKNAVGTELIETREEEWNRRALTVWSKNPSLKLLGIQTHSRLPIFSFLIRDGKGNFAHYQLITRMLSDFFGIQVRGGCVCAGPYGHRLLDISQSESSELRKDILSGNEIKKPGWVRLNLHYAMEEATVSRIIDAVDDLAHSWQHYADQYHLDPHTQEITYIKKSA